MIDWFWIAPDKRTRSESFFRGIMIIERPVKSRVTSYIGHTPEYSEIQNLTYYNANNYRNLSFYLKHFSETQFFLEFLLLKKGYLLLIQKSIYFIRTAKFGYDSYQSASLKTTKLQIRQATSPVNIPRCQNTILPKRWGPDFSARHLTDLSF